MDGQSGRTQEKTTSGESAADATRVPALRMTGAQAVMRSLEEEGVTYLFGYPGGQALELYDALYDSKKLTHVLVRHEQGATHAADGYARATGRPGVVLVTSGPGATNTVTGIACAYMDSVPLIVICGQVESSVIGTDAFQETDITGVTMPIAKHSYLVKEADDLPRIIHEAFHIATTGRPGPVVIDVPSDVAAAPVLYRPCTRIELPSYRPTIRGNARQVKQAVQVLAACMRPVILVGGGVIASGACERLRELSTRLGAPVATTLMGKGAFPERNPLALGVAGIYGAAVANDALARADVLLAIGMRFSDRVTGAVDEFATSAHIIHVDIDPAEIGKNVVPEVPIVGDAKTVIGQMLEQLEKRGVHVDTASWLAYIRALRQDNALERALDADADRGNGDGSGCPATLIEAPQVMRALGDLVETRDAVIVTEVGQHQMWASQLLPTRDPRSFLTSGGLGAMGFGLPAALGAQLGRPEATVVCIAGDGSIQMNVQEMATVRVNDLPVKVVVVDNACLGMVRQMQDEQYQSRYSQTLLPPCPDLVKLAQAYGWKGASVSEPEKLEAALSALFSCDGPALLDVHIDPREAVFSKQDDPKARCVTGDEDVPTMERIQA